jgi:hypothetical protein
MRILLLILLLLIIPLTAAAIVQDARKNCHWHADVDDWVTCIVG